MKFYHKNPRQITNRQFDDLRSWLQELGDLSGIVHDLNSDEIVGGNQRARVFDVNQCEVVLTEGPHEPDGQGTVALGYVVWQDKRYGYRQVRWTPEQCEQANIIANKAGGSWDFEALKGWDTDRLLAWGFEEVELGIMPSGDEWADAFGSVPDGDRAPFQQMTFTLHDTQVEQVKQALGVSKNLGEFVEWLWTLLEPRVRGRAR